MSIFSLWLWFVGIPGVGDVFAWFAGISMVVFLFTGGTFIATVDDATSNKDNGSKEINAWCRKWVFVFLSLFAFFAVTSSMMPTTKQAMMLAGGYAATNNEEIAKLPTNIAKAANQFLEGVSKVDSEDNKKEAK